MAESRRRTMQPIQDQGNVRSGIPMPSTIKKPNQNMLLSVAGSVSRGSHLQPPGTNPRQSMMRSQNVNPLLQSASKPGFGRTPLNSSTRRGSMWAGGSSQPLPSSQSLKDTRPLRDRAYQSKMRQDILSWLQNTSYDSNISMQTLMNITGKDFRSIVTHLVTILDPNAKFDPQTKFEDEFVPALRSLHYPFVNQIDNKWLAAPASMHSWPYLLGAMHWLVEMGKSRIHYLQSGHRTLRDPPLVPEDFDSPDDHLTLAYQYYNDSYGVWLNFEEFTEVNQAYEDRYALKNEGVRTELEAKTVHLDQSKVERKRLISSAAPIEKLLQEHELLKADNVKFQKILDQYDSRKKKLYDTIASEKAELKTRGAYLEQLRADEDKLSQVVKTQNLSPEEVIRMNTDHETLSRNLEELKQKISESNRIVMALEVNVSNRAAAAEEAVETYANLLSSLELYPPLPPPWQDVDLTLELNTAGYNAQQLLSGADIRKVIKPTLSNVAESKRSQRANVESERIKVDNELDQLTLECENVDEETAEVEKKVAGLNEQADDLRDAAQQEALVANGEATRLERDLAQARNAALANGMGVKTRLQALQFSYQEQLQKVARLKEETVRAIAKNSNDIGLFKVEVAKHLQELRDFTERD